MKLETRVRQLIQHHLRVVLLYSDFAPLGSKSGVSHVLNALVKNGELLRLSQGVYAKTKRNEDGAKVSGDLDVIIFEVADKLGYSLHRKNISFEKKITLQDEIVVEIDDPRVKRKLNINGKTIWLRKSRFPTFPTLLEMFNISQHQLPFKIFQQSQPNELNFTTAYKDKRFIFKNGRI